MQRVKVTARIPNYLYQEFLSLLGNKKGVTQQFFSLCITFSIFSPEMTIREIIEKVEFELEEKHD